MTRLNRKQAIHAFCISDKFDEELFNKLFKVVKFLRVRNTKTSLQYTYVLVLKIITDSKGIRKGIEENWGKQPAVLLFEKETKYYSVLFDLKPLQKKINLISR